MAPVNYNFCQQWSIERGFSTFSKFIGAERWLDTLLKHFFPNSMNPIY